MCVCTRTYGFMKHQVICNDNRVLLENRVGTVCGWPWPWPWPGPSERWDPPLEFDLLGESELAHHRE